MSRPNSFTAEEDTQILARAGRDTFRAIGRDLGRSEMSVWSRYSRLTGRPVTPKPPTSTPRTGANRACLCCGRPFQSGGIHNRLCNSCRHIETSPFEP